MRSPTRSFCVYTFSLLVIILTTSFSQAQKPKEPVLSPEKQKLLKERDRLYAEFRKLMFQQRKYTEGMDMLHQVLSLEKKLYGPTHDKVVTRLSTIGNYYEQLGNWKAAQEALSEVVDIRTKSEGKEHYKTQDAQRAIKDLEFRQQLTLQQRQLLRQADQLNSQVGQLYRQGRSKTAIALAIKVVEIRLKLLGEKHPSYATSLNNLAALYKSQGEYGKALPLYQQAMALKKEILGEKHPDYADSLNNLAYVYYIQKDFTHAEKYFLQAAKASLDARLNVSQEGLQRASHTDKHSHLAFLAGVLARNGKITGAWHWLEQSLGRATFDEVTARNNRTQTEQRQLDQLQGSIQQTDQRFKKLTSLRNLSEDQKQIQKRMLKEQSQRYAQLAKLYKQLEEKYGITEGKSYSLEQLQVALADKAAFLTWIDARNEHYVVLLRSKGEPIFVRIKEDNVLAAKLYPLLQTHLGNATERKALLEKLRKQRIDPIVYHLKDIEHVIILPSPQMDKIPTELLLPEKKVSHAPSATMYAYLRQLEKAKGNRLLTLGDPIFNPQEKLKEKPLPNGGILITSVVVKSIADQAGLEANHVLLAYDGHAVNTIDELRKAMIAAKAKKEVRIKAWNHGKEFEKVIPTGSLGVVLSKEPAKIALQNRRKEQWQLVSRGDSWNALPGTRIEVASIANLMDKDHRQVLLDSSASEQQLHQLAVTDKLKEYKYLHFATHGDVNGFLPMQSALILSRDNLRGNIAELKANEPYFDGRLTAKEVALHWTLDADLVTLSACNSGLGKHARGEGYMGFAQSFLIRGSRSVVLSLWSVDDTATALLMKRFYENLIKKKLSKIDALRDAKNWLRTLPRSEVSKLAASMSNGVARGPGRKKLPAMTKVPKTEKKEDAPYAHPYYWSAFILIGDPH